MRLTILGLLAVAAWLSLQCQSASGETSNRASSCPADLETLTSLMLKDLPSYANRVIQRVRGPKILPTYVIIAGRAEFQPLSLGPGKYNPVPSLAKPEAPQQVFFTTLERQYLNNRAIETQNYHWLFLTQTDGGWRMAMLFSRLGSPVKDDPPSPPLETSEGIIGQAVSLWLRDCRAGAIKNHP
mgnify:CR=1 FL=1